MKVLITCKIDIDPEQRATALKEAVPLIALARQEPGCIAYNWGADLAEDSAIYVYEEWASQEAFTAHLTAPSFYGMSEHLTKYGLQGADARKYLIQADSPIYDEQGNARGDFF